MTVALIHSDTSFRATSKAKNQSSSKEKRERERKVRRVSVCTMNVSVVVKDYCSQEIHHTQGCNFPFVVQARIKAVAGKFPETCLLFPGNFSLLPLNVKLVESLPHSSLFFSLHHESVCS